MIKFGQGICSLSLQSHSISNDQQSLDRMSVTIILSSFGLRKKTRKKRDRSYRKTNNIFYYRIYILL